MLEELEQMQKRRYPTAKIWNIREQKWCKGADLVIANLVVEYMGVECLVDMVKKSGAKYASVLIWDVKNRGSLQEFTEREGTYRCVTAQEVISSFQENWLDLIYMREDIEINGALLIRMDFRAVR